MRISCVTLLLCFIFAGLMLFVGPKTHKVKKADEGEFVCFVQSCKSLNICQWSNLQRACMQKHAYAYKVSDRFVQVVNNSCFEQKLTKKQAAMFLIHFWLQLAPGDTI